MNGHALSFLETFLTSPLQDNQICSLDAMHATPSLMTLDLSFNALKNVNTLQVIRD